MKTITIKMTIDSIPVEIRVHKNTNYGILKEYLRDTLTPRITTKQNWGRIVEIIRDTAIPMLH